MFKSQSSIKVKAKKELFVNGVRIKEGQEFTLNDRKVQEVDSANGNTPLFEEKLDKNGKKVPKLKVITAKEQLMSGMEIVS